MPPSRPPPLTPEQRARYHENQRASWHATTVLVSADQRAVLLHLTSSLHWSLAELFDTVFERHFPEYYGISWPRPPHGRVKRRWGLRESKMPMRRNGVDVWPYSVQLTHEQRALIVQLAERYRVEHIFASVTEEAFAVQLPVLFTIPWPRRRRRYDMAWLRRQEELREA